MKKIIKLLLFCNLWIFISSANANTANVPGYNQKFGFGVILGEPTGLTAKYFSNPDNAVDMGLAYSFSDYMLVYGDKIWHWSDAFSGKHDDFVKRLSPYMGVGAGIFLGKKSIFDVRVPFGISWMPIKPTLELFLELVPALRLAPSTGADFGGGIGVRIYLQ